MSMKDEEREFLLVDEEYAPILIEEECEAIKPIIKDFIECYIENKDKSVETWLEPKLHEQLPERSSKEIKQITSDIINTISIAEEKRKSLDLAISDGRSKEEWFASDVKKATAAMSTLESVKYLTNLDNAMQNANTSLYRTITTQAGVINQNPHLDGFIAEQYHAQTFNLNAEAKGSQYRAKVLEPTGQGYTKNSVDIVIVDGNGKVVKRYQSKYCKDAQATNQAFENGDYRGQTKLVPEEQSKDIPKKTSNILESPDGTTSNPLTKNKAEQMRDEAQSGQWNELNWNEYKAKDLAVGIGKQAGYAALQGAAIDVGFDIAKKVWNGEKIKGEEIVETALLSGADFGVKAAAAGAIKVGVERDIIKVIPKGTPASIVANIVCVAVEDAKILGKMATGELTAKEGIEKLEQTTVSVAAGLVAAGKGAAIGTAAGAVFGPAGMAIGGFVGGTIGYMAGSKVGEAVVKGAQKVREVAKTVIKSVGTGIINTFSTVKSSVTNFCSGVKSLFGF